VTTRPVIQIEQGRPPDSIDAIWVRDAEEIALEAMRALVAEKLADRIEVGRGVYGRAPLEG
jgi:hypothetical protein